MNNQRLIKVAFITIVLVCLIKIAYAAGIKTMPNVKQEMLSAAYWIQKMGNPNEVIMTSYEIKKFNSDIIEELPTVMLELNKMKEKYTRDEIKKVVNITFPLKPCYIDGKKVSKEYKEKIIKQLNVTDIPEESTVKYGVAVKRTNMKAIPTRDIISDDPNNIYYDIFQNAAVHVNEPMVIIHESLDKEWVYAYTESCSGWVQVSDVAVCTNRGMWLNRIKYNDFIVVTGDKIYLEANQTSPELSQLELSMGTVLPIAKQYEIKEPVDGKYTYNNYVTKIPVKDKNGELNYKIVLIPVSRDVNVGFLPYTRANILNQAFKMQGNRYGWGGMLDSRDCSLFIQDVYRCFGIRLPRNSTAQSKIPSKTAELSDIDIESKKQALDNLQPGAVLYFPGHVMMYIGKENDRYYVISSLGSFATFGFGSNNKKVIHANSVTVNDLSIKRVSGIEWIEAISTAKQIERAK